LTALFSLAGRTALVTGASTAIGRDIAVMLADAGADVVVSARSEPALERAVAEIRALGRKSSALTMDLTDVDALERAPRTVVDEFGSLDIVVNAAGATYAGIGEPSVDATEELWDRHFDVNLKASFFLARSAARLMLERGYGKIVNVASTFSFVGVPGMAAYCASKGGVVQLTRALAAEWAPRGINVNGVAPGAVLTEISAPNLGTEEGLRGAVAHIPAGRLVTTQDVAAAALFLSAPASDMVHGHTLVVDGGTTIV
jgi:2-deoxy-D-gluconate 3-dehydrogenase